MPSCASIPANGCSSPVGIPRESATSLRNGGQLEAPLRARNLGKHEIRMKPEAHRDRPLGTCNQGRF